MKNYNVEEVKEELEETNNADNEIEVLRKFIVELYNYNSKNIIVKNDKFEMFIKEHYSDDFGKKKLNLIIRLYQNNYIIFLNDNGLTLKYDRYHNDNLETLTQCINNFINKNNTIKISFYSNDLPDYILEKIDEIQENANKIKKENEEILNKIQNYNKQILTIMALFVSIVALLTANVSALGNLTALGIIAMNLSLIISIVIIFLLINNIVGNVNSKAVNNVLGTIFIFILGTILWIIVSNNTLDMVHSTSEKENINNNYNQSFQFDIKGGTDD